MSIINKASQLTGGSTLIIGQSGSGKTTHAINIVKHHKKVLFVSFNNSGTLSWTPEAKDFDVAEPTDWATFDKHILTPIRSGEMSYDAIVIDGGNVALQYILSSVNPAQPTQADWATAGKKLAMSIVVLKAACLDFCFIVDIMPDDEGVDRIAMNRDAVNRTIPLFGNKVYAFTEPVKDAKNVVTGVKYGIQQTPALALRFIPVRNS